MADPREHDRWHDDGGPALREPDDDHVAEDANEGDNREGREL